jgi:prepilin-type N-terminal cleavage/methylation domain-containing protein
MKLKSTKQKGFTLVELLVVIVILGIITLMSYPVIRNISNKLDNSKFNTYKKTLVSSAKVYVSDYSEDLFGYNDSGCSYVSFRDLKKRGLIKDISVSGYSCDSDNTFVKVVKVGSQYHYSSYLYCSKSGNGAVILPTQDTPHVQEATCTVDTNSSFDITAFPKNNTENNNRSISVAVKISSYSGINGDNPPQIGYAWSTSNVLSDAPTLTYADLSFNVPSKASQDNTRLGGNAVTVKSNKVFTPSSETGKYYLFIKINNIVNYNGESFNPTESEENLLIYDGKYYKVFGPYKIDNTPPEILDTSTLISTAEGYNNDKPQLKLYVSDNYTEKEDLKVCISYSSGKCTSWDIYSETINVTEKLGDIPDFKYDGSVYSVYVSVKDKAGNTTKKRLSYKSYIKCTDTKYDGEWTDSTSCGKCGVATKDQYRKTKDKYLDKTCPDVTRTTNCAHPNCCSSTNKVLANSSTTSCSRQCASGTQTTTNTYTKYSYYDDTYVCESNIVTQYESSCNNIPCTPYIDSATSGVSYSCSPSEEYTTAARTCSVVWPSSGSSTFWVTTKTTYSGTWYKYVYNSESNSTLCDFVVSTNCSSGINRGVVKWYWLDSQAQRSPIVTVNVWK